MEFSRDLEKKKHGINSYDSKRQGFVGSLTSEKELSISASKHTAGDAKVLENSSKEGVIPLHSNK